MIRKDRSSYINDKENRSSYINDKENRSSYINDKENRILSPGLGCVTVIYDTHVHINTMSMYQWCGWERRQGLSPFLSFNTYPYISGYACVHMRWSGSDVWFHVACVRICFESVLNICIILVCVQLGRGRMIRFSLFSYSVSTEHVRKNESFAHGYV